jgi:hypothetical protein
MNKTEGKAIPSARNNGLVVQRLEGEVLVYDTERHTAHCLNHNAALIWEHCDGKRTASQLSELLQSANGNPKTTSKEKEELVWVALDQLDKSHLLDGPVIRPEITNGMTRRQLMKAAGIAALIAVPVVSTIVAPKAAEAATCLASGQGCTISSQCCSGLCSAGACV